MSAGILAPERVAERRVEVQRELDRRREHWTALGVLVMEYGTRRVITVCSREALAGRLTMAIAVSTIDADRENFSGALTTVLSQTDAVPVLVVSHDEVAVELAAPVFEAGELS